MDILYLAFSYPPNRAISANRAFVWTSGLAARGHRVRVVTAEALGSLADPRHLNALASSGVEVVRTSGAGSRRLMRAREKAQASRRTSRRRVPGLSWLRQTLKLEPEAVWLPEALATCARLIRERRPDVIFITGRPFVAFHLAPLLRLSGAAVVLDLRDPWSLSYDRGEPTTRALAAQEAWVFRHADAILLNTKASFDAYQRVYAGQPVAERMHLIPNVVTQAPPSEAATRRDPFVVFYGGTLYSRDLNPLIRAFQGFVRARGLDASQARLELVGNIHADCYDKAVLDGAGDLVRLRPPIPHADFAAELDAASVSVMHIGRFRLCTPGKFFESLSKGKPMFVIGPSDHPLRATVAELGIGASADEADEAGLRQALDALYDEVVPRMEAEPLPAEALDALSVGTWLPRLEAVLEGVALDPSGRPTHPAS